MNFQDISTLVMFGLALIPMMTGVTGLSAAFHGTTKQGLIWIGVSIPSLMLGTLLLYLTFQRAIGLG